MENLMPLKTAVLALVSIVLIVAAVILLNDGTENGDIRDPIALGPFAVGFTTRSVERTVESGAGRTVEYSVWYPSKSSAEAGAVDEAAEPLPMTRDAPPVGDTKRPLLLFSHGFGGSPSDFAFLHTHIASHSFIVVAPFHDCDGRADYLPAIAPVGRTCYEGAGPLPFPELNALRLDDANAVLEDVLSAGDELGLANLIDTDRIGVGGFSFGGATALQLLETNPRFRAALVQAPLMAGTDPSRVTRPLMVLQGEWDHNTPLALSWDFFTRIPGSAPDHWYVDMHRTGHLSFSPQCISGLQNVFPPCTATLPPDEVAAIVKRWATPFLLARLAGESRYESLLEPSVGPDASVIRKSGGVTSAPLPTVVPFSASSTGLTPTPIASPGTTLLTDDLTSPSATFSGPNTEGAPFSATYSQGAFVISTLALAQPLGGTSQPQVILPGSYADVAVAVDAALVNPAHDQFINIACRSQEPGSEYRLTILPMTSQFQVIQWIRGTSSSLTGLQTSPAIRPGTATNRLELSCQGSVIEARINGVQVASVTTGVFSEGRVWIGMGQVAEGPEPRTLVGTLFAVRFTNLVVQQR